MKSFIVLLAYLLATVAITCADPDPLIGAFGLTNAFGGGLAGLGGGTNAVADANGKAGSVLGLANGDGTILDVAALLNLKDTNCLKKCPTMIANTKLKCVASSTFPNEGFCIGVNSFGKIIYPCNPIRPKDKDDD